jgi:hypothetical protein
MKYHDFKAKINELQINGKLSHEDVVFITSYVNQLRYRILDMEKWIKENLKVV